MSAATKTQNGVRPVVSGRCPTRAAGPRLIRRAPLALIIGLALIASLAFGVGSASAAPPEEPKVTFVEATAEYTTAHLVWKTESPYTIQYLTEYTSDLSSPNPPQDKWEVGNGQGIYGPFGTVMPPGTNTIVEDMTGLEPDTEYQFRFVSFGSFGSSGSEEEYRQFQHPGAPPYDTFTTKPLTKPHGSLDPVSEITINSAHIQGTVDTGAPPGPLSAAQKAAYRTTWQLVCRPSCQFGTGESSGVVEGDEPIHSFTWDTIRLETNTYYEIELTTTNGDGHQTTITTEFFSTPNIAPKISPAPGGSSGKGAYSVGGIVTPYNTKITDCHFEYGPTTEYVYSAPCSPQPVGRDEVQVLTIPGTDGQFRLVFRGQTTKDINFPAPPEIVEEELRALSAIGPEGIIKVTREQCFFCWTYKFYFGGPLGGTNLNPLKAINGTIPIYVEDGVPDPNPDVGFAGAIVEGGNNDPVVVEADLTGLTPGATYHYKVFATNNVGTVSSEDVRFVVPTDPADEPCPNEGVRIENNSTRLPECRAYELVTNAFTTGYGATMLGFPTGQLGINEGTLSYTSLAGNINNSGWGGIFGTTYVAIRHDSGWETLANLNGPRGSIFAPPNNVAVGFGPSQYSTDLLRSLWFLSKPGEPPYSPYLRESDGTFTKMSDPPMVPRSNVVGQYLGASEDLTHTFWIGKDYETETWGPGVGVGLYQFVGTGNTGFPHRIDLHDDGTPISECSVGPYDENAASFNKFSADGKTVWFTVKECEGHKKQIWVRVDMSKSYFASKSQCTRTAGDPGGVCNEEMSATFELMSRDASRAIFTTNQQLLNSDTDQTTDLYEYILPTASDPNPSPSLIQVSGAATGARVRNAAAISGDGRRIYFIAQGVLASNHDAHDLPPFADDFNLYVWQQDAAHPDGETKFVARLEDLPNNYDLSSFNPRISADGRYMVFLAYHPMVETDTDNSLDVYRYDAVTGEMTRVSVDIAGVGGNADFTDAVLAPKNVLSNDGGQVVFTTSEALSPDDGNGASDAYLWQEGHTSLVSTGAVGGGANSVLIDGSGNNIYITSRQQLTADDIDDVDDVYDVRRGGGFSFKEIPPCAGEGCQPAGTPAPDNGAPANNHAGGEGNYRPATIAIKSMSRSQRAKLAAGGVAEVPLKVSGPGKISLNGTTRIGKTSAKAIEATSRAVQAGIVKVRVTLSRRALTKLRRRGTLSVYLSAVVADSETATATLKLKAAEPRRKRSKRGNG